MTIRASHFARQLAAASLLLASSLIADTYHLTFDDEFNSFNSSRWQTADFWGTRNNGGDYQGQWFCDPTYAPSGYTTNNPFSATNGVLTIQAMPTPTTNTYAGAPTPNAQPQPYVSGQLTSAHKFTQRYGYYELRAKLPPGKGLWSRFWLLCDDGAWPGEGEYDIFEVLGRENPSPAHQTTHFRNINSTHGIDGYTYTNGGFNAADGSFHTYGFLWDPKTITWYVDGVATLKQDNRINKPMYVLIDLAVGNDPPTTWPGSPDGTTPWPANMEIEYFRVYSADPSLPSVTPDAGYSTSVIPDGNTVEVTPTTAALPAGWTADDIVSPAAYLGSTTWNTNTGEWMLKGTSYANGNQYQFASTSLAGDGAVIATVRDATGVNGNSGVMIRESTAQGARQMSLLYTTPLNSPPYLTLLSRTNTSGTTDSLTVTNISAPVTLRLLRTVTNTYTAAYSTNGGVNWITVGTALTNTMGSTVLAGLVEGGNTGDPKLGRAIFNNVTVGQFAPMLAPATGSVVTSQTMAFTASLINQLTSSPTSTGPVTWSVASGGGTIDTNGVYTAPALMGTGTAIIKAVFGTNVVTSTIAVVLPSPWSVPSLVHTPPSDAGLASGVWTVVGGGTGISTNGTQDWFRFVSSAMSGNGTNTVMVNSLGGSQAGLVIRDSINAGDAFPNANARYAGIWCTATGLVWATRETTNALLWAQVATTQMPIWLRLTRSGASLNIFAAYYSTDGSAWTQLGSSRTFTMSSPALVGLAVASGSQSTTATNTFSNINFIANTTTTVATSVSPTTYGQSVTFTATIAPASGSTVPTGAVQFRTNGMALGSPVTVTSGVSPNGTASISTTNLPFISSPYTVTADYTATISFASSTGTLSGGQTVNKATAMVTVTPYSVTYDGSSHTATAGIVTGVNGETGATVGSVVLNNTTHTNAGSYPSDSWALAGGANYNDIGSTTISNNISKATPTVLVTVGSYTNNGSPQGPNTFTTIPSGDTGTATWSYVGVSGTTYGPSATRPTAAGNYTAQVTTLTSDANFNSSSSSATAFTIANVNVLFTDNYTVSTSSFNINFENTLGRQAGSLFPLSYLTEYTGASAYLQQLGNTTAFTTTTNALFLFGNAGVRVDYDFSTVAAPLEIRWSVIMNWYGFANSNSLTIGSRSDGYNPTNTALTFHLRRNGTTAIYDHGVATTGTSGTNFGENILVDYKVILSDTNGTGSAFGSSGSKAAYYQSGTLLGTATLSQLTSGQGYIGFVGGVGNVGVDNLQILTTASPASTNAYLLSLVVSPSNYTSTFASNAFTYTATNFLPNNRVTVTVTNADLNATNTISYNGTSQGTLASGLPSSLLNLTQVATNVLKVLVTAQDGLTTNLYTVNVILQPSQTQPYLTNRVSGGTNLLLNWPADHTGWRLLVQTNNLPNGVSSNTNDWATVANSSNTNQVFVPIVITNRSEFYRIVYP